MEQHARDLRDTIVPKSDQLNADDLLAGPVTVTVAAVRRGNAEQPVEVALTDRLPFRPCKSMRRVLIVAWGDDGAAWVGRSMTLFRDPETKFGGVKVGGIRISHLSHIDRPLDLPLMVTRGQRQPYHVDVLRIAAPSLDEVLAAQGATLADADAFAQANGKPLPSAGDEKARAKWAAYFVKHPEVLAKAEPEPEPEIEPADDAAQGDDDSPL